MTTAYYFELFVNNITFLIREEVTEAFRQFITAKDEFIFKDGRCYNRET